MLKTGCEGDYRYLRGFYCWCDFSKPWQLVPSQPGTGNTESHTNSSDTTLPKSNTNGSDTTLPKSKCSTACQTHLTADEIDYIVSELEECSRKSKILSENLKTKRPFFYTSLPRMFVSTFNAERLSIVDSSHLLLPTWPCPRWLFRFTVNWKKLRFCTEKTIILIKARMFLASVLKLRYQSLTLKYNTEPSKPHIHVKNPLSGNTSTRLLSLFSLSLDQLVLLTDNG